MLPSNFGIGQEVNRDSGLGVVAIGFVYHGVLEVPRQLRGRPATSYLANQVHVTPLVVRLLQPRDVPRRPVQYHRLRRRNCAPNTHAHV